MARLAVAATSTTAGPASLAASRYASGAREVANGDRSPIQELSAQVGVNSDGFAFHSRGHGEPGDGGQGRDSRREAVVRAPARHRPVINATSEVFAAIFEMPDAPIPVDLAEQGFGGEIRNRYQAFTGDRALVIRTYETNARVIAGDNRTTGRNMSFSL